MVYSKLTPSPNLAYGVFLPLDIVKVGGTAEARKKLAAINFANPEMVYMSGLAEMMIMGLLEGNFGKIFESVKAYSEWEKSVTFVRNEPTAENPNGIYGIDVNQMSHSLEDVASFFHVKKTTIYRMCRNGQIPYVQWEKGGSMIIFNEVLQRAIKAHTVEPLESD